MRFKPKIIEDGVVWCKVRNQKHRDKLELSNNYRFKRVFDRTILFGYSFHLYYSDWVFVPDEEDTQIMSELDEMVSFFVGDNYSYIMDLK